ncbi:hypothetical protein CP02DC21_0631 [Chlamydia psittaci 02DC21]|nr:hypothetical protein CP02DC21_0631 [Chlamydia psittaci 02DC21]
MLVISKHTFFPLRQINLFCGTCTKRAWQQLPTLLLGRSFPSSCFYFPH